MKKFFYRMDKVKKICLGVSLVVSALCWFVPLGGYIAFVIGPIADVVLLFSLIPWGVPKEQNVVEKINLIREDQKKTICAKHKNNQTNTFFLSGFARSGERLCREINGKAVYPVCKATLLSFNDDGAIFIQTNDTSLFDSSSSTKSLNIDQGGVLSLSMQKGSFRSVLLSIHTPNNESIEMYIHEFHSVRDLISKHGKYISVDEESRKLL